VDQRAIGPAGDPAGAYHQIRALRRRERTWRAGLLVLAFAVVGLAAATIVVSVEHRHHSSASSPAGTSTSSSSSSTSIGPSGAGPVITALVPSFGSAGQTITIDGSGLFSADGHVVARFNGQVAPTACPSGNSCTATVPAGSSGSATVTVSTDSGTSNGLTFTYQ